MKILVTGAFGNVGRSTLKALKAKGDQITVLEADTLANRRLVPSLAAGCRVIFGDVRDAAVAREAVEGQDAICHLAALIPPAADRAPELARSINVGGTRNLLDVALACGAGGGAVPRFVLASSIAAYGDRLKTPWISTRDRLISSPGDVYAETKIECERLVRESGVPFTILRLTYIVWAQKIHFDPLFFHMPPATFIEICHTEDTGRAFAAAARVPEAEGATFNIGGGETCRTTFRDYLDRMLKLFGLRSSSFLPDKAFAPDGFHCGWLTDSDEAERVLHFRGKTIEDYYKEVGWETRLLRPWAAMVAPIVRQVLLKKSPFLPRRRRGPGSTDKGFAQG